MKINLLTSAIKKCNYILNVSLLLFALTGICLIIGYLFFLETESFIKGYINASIFAGAMLFTALALSVIKDNLKKKIFLEINGSNKLEINSTKQPLAINNRNDIRYSGNFIITDNKRLEIDNYMAFHILNHELITDMRKVETRTNLLEMDPNKLVEKVRSLISNGIFAAGHK